MSLSSLSLSTRFRISRFPPLTHTSSSPLALFSSFRPSFFRAAVVGSGPSGLYTAETILKEIPNSEVDLIESLPVPFGLIRFGVAPDHPEVKIVAEKFDRLISSSERLRFFGNVTVGKQPIHPHGRCIDLQSLGESYNCVVFCGGADDERRLNLNLEETATGVHSAREFVGWYNSHPSFEWKLIRSESYKSQSPFCLDEQLSAVAIIGNGNVSLDVARILLRASSFPSESATDLFKTDISSAAFDQIKKCKNLHHIHVIGRRGPAQSAFTNKELREILTMDGISRVFIAKEDFEMNEQSRAEMESTRATKRSIQLLESKATKIPLEELNHGTALEAGKKNLYLHFLQSPTELLVDSIDSQILKGITLERNSLVGAAGDQKARGTGVFSSLHQTQLLIKSIGYKSKPVDGLPFDLVKGIIPNEKGRVALDNESGHLPPVYVAGWCKRGPFGIIGTNFFDVQETVKCIVDDLNSGLLSKRDVKTTDALWSGGHASLVSYADWKKIDAAEIEIGSQKGKVREKFPTFESLLQK